MKEKKPATPDSASNSSFAQPPQKTNPRWSAVRKVRLPHKMGLPLGSGGGGDTVER